MSLSLCTRQVCTTLSVLVTFLIDYCRSSVKLSREEEMLPGYVPIVSHWYEVLIEKTVQVWLELLESFGPWVIVGSAKRPVRFWEQEVLVMMVYTPVWLSDVYWQIEDLITLNLLLIVDGIMLDDIKLFCYLNGKEVVDAAKRRLLRWGYHGVQEIKRVVVVTKL